MTYIPSRDLCDAAEHYVWQYKPGGPGECLVCHAPYGRWEAEHLADDETPHTADIVEPWTCVTVGCERKAVPGPVPHCHVHLSIGVPHHNRRKYPT